MSGGSHNYLYVKEPAELTQMIQQLDDTAERLRNVGAIEAAKRTASLSSFVSEYLQKVQSEIDALQNIWHAIEWFDSCDWGIDQLNAVISQYEKENKS